jgi:hypothetical protein|tara:strand:+ start:757 stop:1644 length:888 start_codon:yes stop_codon:yes gene_type:complete
VSNLPEFFIDRVLTKEEADKVVGETVSDHQPDVSEAGIYRDRATGEAILLYAPYPAKITSLRKAVLDTNYSTTLRASGTRNNSRVFGFTNRSAVLQRESCTPTSLAWESPEAQMTLNDTAEVLGDYLREQLPEVFEHDLNEIGAVLPEWRMTEDALWTSGVINQASALPYHRDGSNFDTWSAMPVVRRGMDGGNLHMPEYGITINCRDGWALWFNGHAYVHGVTPLAPRSKDGYRYSIVFYAKRGMKDCHTYAVEVGEARKRRAEREITMKDTSLESAKAKIKNGRSNGDTRITK